MVSANDYPHSLASAKIIKTLSTQTEDGINNFRYCVQSNTNRPCTPFFPGSYGPDEIGNIKVSIGLENGILANVGLGMCKNPHDVGIKFLDYYKTQVAGIVRTVAEKTGGMKGWEYAGLDSSLNPSLEPGGSVAQAIEDLPWVNGGISGVGVVGAAASITTAIQNLGYMRVGYCGIMLPVCEDRRLSEVQMGDGEREGDGRYFNVTHLMNVSSVCGVGVDTVPLRGDVEVGDVAGVIMDVCGLAERWDKPLSVRMFPVGGKGSGGLTEFDSPYLCNTRVFEL